MITADVNAHSPLWYLPNEDHKGELIKDILFNSNHITLNTNTPSYLPPNQTQQLTSPGIITALTDLHDLHQLPQHPITYLYSPSLVYVTRSKQLTFTSLQQ